ncbi:MAG: hypothetical protein ACJ77F_10865 [Chloroflexota bacterium]
MDNTARDALRKQIERALDAVERLKPSHLERSLQPVPVGPGSRNRPVRRTIRPVRSWSRLVRI